MYPFCLHFQLKEALREFEQNPLFRIGTVFGRGKITHSSAIPQPSKDSIFLKILFFGFAISILLAIFAE